MIDLTSRVLRAFRWILLVFYFGLGIGLVIFAAAYLAKTASFASKALSNDSLDNGLTLLGLIDGALIAGLLVLVMTSGFEIFVGKLVEGGHRSGPATVGFSALKTKFALTITAIGAVTLLEYSLDIQHLNIKFMIALSLVELVFVAVTLALAWIEQRGTGHAHRPCTERNLP
jgi:uncharacterized protein (TIGR00645 family)